ncbi:cytochrome c biogenesis protein CcsA [Anaplasmataceae bacterium AB001_6]|nr:cytochrome c biogenesis protein CcsA [Anaplasmataceae bacterium AB001_6]
MHYLLSIFGFLGLGLSLLAHAYRPKKPLVGFLFLSISILILIFLYLDDAFILKIVNNSSSINTNSIYKLLAVYSNNEGSLITLSWFLSCFNIGLFFIVRIKDEIKDTACIIQSYIIVFFILLTIIFANPFEVDWHKSDNGLGFNPLLHDIAYTIHPPSIFLGYLGSSVLFSISTALFIHRDFSIIWFKILRDFSLILFSFLTIGISLGSWWAYRELGWGGFWFWDPVENVSLLTWLFSVMLIHILCLSHQKKKYKKISLFVANTVFLSTILGSFFTRSGIIYSVHSFAFNFEMGFAILIIFCILSFFTVILFRRCNITDDFNANNKKDLSSTLLLISILSTLLLISIILFGLFYPIFFEIIFSEKIILEEGYYNYIFNWVVLISILLQIILPYFLSYKKKLFNVHFAITVLFIFLSILVYFYIFNKIHFNIKIFCAFCISFSTVLIMISNFIFRGHSNKNKSYYCMFFAHLGIALIILGVTCAVHKKSVYNKSLSVGDSFIFNKKYFYLQDNQIIKEKDYISSRLVFLCEGKKILSDYRFYADSNIIKTKIGLGHFFLSDFYIIITDLHEDGIFSIQIHHYPGIFLIWLGAFFTTISGLIPALCKVIGIMSTIKRKYDVFKY